MSGNNELYLRIVTDLADVQKDLHKLGVNFAQFSDGAKKKVNSISATMAQFGLAVQGAQQMIMMTQRTVQGFVSPASNLQEAMLGVQKTTGLLDDEMADLQKRLVALSIVTGQPAEELAKISEIAGQLGIKGVADLEAFTVTISKMTKTTDLDVQEASARLAQLANVYDIPIKNVERLGDVINELSNNTSANAQDIVEGVRRIGKSGEELGFSFADMAGISATLKEMGIDAERGGTAVRNVMIRLQTQTKIMAKHMGMSQREWSKMVSADGRGALLAYLKTLQAMDQVARSEAIAKAFGQEGFLAVNSLSGAVEMLGTNMAMANEQFAKGGSLQTEFDNMMRGLNAQVDRFVQLVKAQLINLGGMVIPSLTEAFQWLTANWNYMISVAKVSGRVLSILSAVWLTYVGYVKLSALWTQRQVIWTKLMTLAQRGLNVAMIANPIGLILGLLAGLVTVLMSSGQGVKLFSDVWTAMGVTVRDIITNFDSIVRLVFYGLTYPIRFGWNVIKSFGTAFQSMFSNMGQVVKGFWKILQGDFGEGWEMMKKGTAGLASAVTQSLSDGLTAGDPINQALSDINFSKTKGAWDGLGQEAWDALKAGFTFKADSDPVTPPDLNLPTLGSDGGDGPTQGITDQDQALKNLMMTQGEVKNTSRDLFLSMTSGAQGLSRAFGSVLDDMAKRFLSYIWDKYLVGKLFRDKEMVDDAVVTTASVANSTVRATANTVEAGTGVASSASKIPFPGNLIAIAGGIAILLALIRSMKSKAGGAVKAMAHGGALTRGAEMVLAGEAGVELFAPQKDFLTYAREVLTPKIQGDKKALNQNGETNLQALESKMDQLISAVTSRRTLVSGRDIIEVSRRGQRSRL